MTATASLRTFAEYRKQPDFGTSVDHDFDSWLIAPCGTNRDADTVQRSNFAEMCAELERIERAADTEDESAEMYAVHRFGHWACGWVELVIVRPGSAAAEYAAECAERLESYPVLSDDGLSQLESDDAAESWKAYGADDFKRAMRDEFGERRAAEFVADATDEHLREFMEELYPNEPYHFDSGGCVFPADRAAKNCTRDQLAAFVRKQRRAMADAAK